MAIGDGHSNPRRKRTSCCALLKTIRRQTDFSASVPAFTGNNCRVAYMEVLTCGLGQGCHLLSLSPGISEPRWQFRSKERGAGDPKRTEPHKAGTSIYNELPQRHTEPTPAWRAFSTWETRESHQLETLNPKKPTGKERQPPTLAFH